MWVKKEGELADGSNNEVKATAASSTRNLLLRSWFLFPSPLLSLPLE